MYKDLGNFLYILHKRFHSRNLRSIYDFRHLDSPPKKANRRGLLVILAEYFIPTLIAYSGDKHFSLTRSQVWKAFLSRFTRTPSLEVFFSRYHGNYIFTSYAFTFYYHTNQPSFLLGSYPCHLRVACGHFMVATYYCPSCKKEVLPLFIP